PTTAAQAAWSVAAAAKQPPEQPRVDRRNASPPVGSVTEPAAPNQTPAPEQSRVNRDRRNGAPHADPIPSPPPPSPPPDKKPFVAAPAAAIPAADRPPAASDAQPTPAPKDIERGFDAARAQTVAEPAK